MTAARSHLLAAAAILALAAAGAGGYGLARLTAAKPAPTASDGRKVLYWYDPMVPAQHFDKPGKSPFMDMQLVAKYADEGGGEDATTGVRIDPTASQNLGVRTAEVREGVLADGLLVAGTVAFDERAIAIVQTRAAGFVRKTYGRAPGDVVAAGAPLADLLAPEWGGAQAEYLAVGHTGDAALTAAARQRLRLLGMSEVQIAAVERDGQPRPVITITAPIGGAITKLDVRPGMTLTQGQSLAQINGLDRVWILAAVPEAQGSAIRAGQTVRVTLPRAADTPLSGRVQSVLPEVQGDTRTLQARIELPNPGGRLHPGMLASVAFGAERRSALLVPSEAVIRTGRRDVVLLAQPNGRYQAVEVKTGAESSGQTQITAGLTAGQKVVSSGQFMLDSEASLSGLAVRPLPAEGPTIRKISETGAAR
jgi:membrane fusion protein, copper/silver efflux system